MHQVFGICRKEGGYHIPHLGKTLGLFFAPIVFGGAIGPEAGIAGFATAGFTAVLDKTRIGGTGAPSADTHPFRRAIRTLLDTDDEAQTSKEAKETLQELPLRKLWKVLLWILAAIFFVLGWACVSHVLGSAGEMPRFEGIDYATADWGAGSVALLLDYAFALFALAAQRMAASISSAVGPDPLKKALLAGLVLGGLACILPDLTLSGQDDIVDLIDTWQSWVPALLILVAFVKICMTKMCVWRSTGQAASSSRRSSAASRLATPWHRSWVQTRSCRLLLLQELRSAAGQESRSSRLLFWHCASRRLHCRWCLQPPGLPQSFPIPRRRQHEPERYGFEQAGRHHACPLFCSRILSPAEPTLDMPGTFSLGDAYPWYRE